MHGNPTYMRESRAPHAQGVQRQKNYSIEDTLSKNEVTHLGGFKRSL